MLSNTTAVILAGGFGTRLKEVLPDCQKVIAPVAGKPFLKYILTQVNSLGIKEVVLCTGHLAEQVQSELGNKFLDLNITYSVEIKPLGTAGAIAQALDKIKTEDVLVLNGDSFCDTDFLAFYNWHKINNFKASLLLCEVEDTERFGRVVLTKNNLIESFQEKGIKGPGLINAGIYLFSRKILEEIPKDKTSSLEKELFLSWLDKKKLSGYKAKVQYFIDIGTPQSWNQAIEVFSKWNLEK